MSERRTNGMLIPILALVTTLLSLAGCAAHPIHPGTANAFDSSTYDTLTITDSVIQSTKIDLAEGKFPVAIAGNVKSALNNLISVYDVLEISYCDGKPMTSGGTSALQCSPGSYHAAAIAGTATPAQNSAIQTQVGQVSVASAALATAKGGN